MKTKSFAPLLLCASALIPVGCRDNALQKQVAFQGQQINDLQIALSNQQTELADHQLNNLLLLANLSTNCDYQIARLWAFNSNQVKIDDDIKQALAGRPIAAALPTNRPAAAPAFSNYMRLENQKFLAKRAAARAAAKKTERKDLAEVVQIVPDGLLVNFITGIGPLPEAYAQAAVDGKVKPDYSFGRELTMLWQFPKSNIVDGQFLIVTSYAIGTYDYETVNHAVKTVPRFTDWLDTAEVWQNAPESDILKKGGPDGRNFAFTLP